MFVFVFVLGRGWRVKQLEGLLGEKVGNRRLNWNIIGGGPV